LAGSAGPGESPIYGRDRVLQWEREHRPIEEGDAVLLRTGWTDAHYRIGEAGHLYAQAVVDGETAAWPGLDEAAMSLLVERPAGPSGSCRARRRRSGEDPRRGRQLRAGRGVRGGSRPARRFPRAHIPSD